MFKHLLVVAVVAGSSLIAQPAFAQCGCNGTAQSGGGYGMTQPVCTDGYGGVRFALRDRYSPRSVYAYGRNGVRASWEHAWNTERAQQTSWHGGYRYWRWGTPTALVVPPTAAFQTSYGWGVGQTRSMPIYAQFEKAGVVGSNTVNDENFGTAPYWPSHTGQFGVYPVRGPWN